MKVIDLTTPELVDATFGDEKNRKDLIAPESCKLSVIRKSDGKNIFLKVEENDTVSLSSGGEVIVGPKKKTKKK